MKRILTISVILFLLGPNCNAQAKNENPSHYPAYLVLRNGGYMFLDISFTRFLVRGTVNLDDKQVLFVPDSIFNTGHGRVLRYNHLIKPLPIKYSEVKKIKYGCYFSTFVPVAVPTIIMKDGTKYRISVKKAKALKVKSQASQ